MIVLVIGSITVLVTTGLFGLWITPLPSNTQCTQIIKDPMDGSQGNYYACLDFTCEHDFCARRYLEPGSTECTCSAMWNWARSVQVAEYGDYIQHSDFSCDYGLLGCISYFCQNECPNEGYEQCVSGQPRAREQCQRTKDGANCLEWNRISDCPVGQECVDTGNYVVCQSTCTNECTWGYMKCVGNEKWYCGECDADSCDDWCYSSTCPSGTTCVKISDTNLQCQEYVCPPEYSSPWNIRYCPEIEGGLGTCPNLPDIEGGTSQRIKLYYQGDTMNIPDAIASYSMDCGIERYDNIYYYDGSKWYSYDNSIDFNLNTLRTFETGKCYSVLLTPEGFCHWANTPAELMIQLIVDFVGTVMGVRTA